jgi:hypothetical protein
VPSISSKEDDTILLSLTVDEFNFIRQVVSGFCINTPKIAWATYTNYDENEIEQFTDQMYQEAEKFDIDF